MSFARFIIESIALTISRCFKLFIFIYNILIDNFLNPLPLFSSASIKEEQQQNEDTTTPLNCIDTINYANDRAQLQKQILEAIDIVDICHSHGFKVHEHVVQTVDGYLLAIHRLIPTKITSKKERSYSTSLQNLNQNVVYFHHGLLTNSELWVLGDKTSKNLPFILAENGFDVWLGNNRGNKYSRKHVELSAQSYEFWNYSLDEYAMYDIPNTIDYILEATRQPNLTYIGFSQGSAQCLAALSLSPKLNDKINLFIGLSPAMVPKGLNHPIASFFVNSAQSFLYNLFGRRAILPSVVFWQQIMGSHRYKNVVDKSLVLLFGWQTTNISDDQKTIGYQHMFSPSSVKSVVHWLQIIKNKRFQMYDEGGNAGSKLIALGPGSTRFKAHRVAPFPTQTIYTPVLLIYGGNDSLIDIDKTLDNLSCPAELIKIDSYEHMDTLWAEDVNHTVFAPILKKLKQIHNQDLDTDLGPDHNNSHTNGNGTTTVIENNGSLNLTLNPATTKDLPQIIQTNSNGSDSNSHLDIPSPGPGQHKDNDDNSSSSDENGIVI